MTKTIKLTDKNDDFYGNCRAIIIKDGKIVAMHRVKKGDEFYVTPGGHKELGEDDYTCCKREVMEEFGIEVEPKKIIYECAFNGLYQCYIVCDWVSGNVHVTDGEEYDRMTVDNQYYPTTIDINKLKDTDFRPHEVRDEIVSDLEKYTTLEDVEFKVLDVIKK
ncbi:MAG: NUDIX domain-containing protein [Clostridia bacterium]|nr:NUDIX domain-containing protein [Clostridia bacterium]